MSTVQQPETSFYIALPSDSSTQFFPENTLSGYTTKLPRDIVLNGEWECGVAEIRYPLTFFNVSEPMSLTKVYDPPPLQQTLQFLPGYYTANDVVSQINTFIGTERGEIKVSKHTGKTTMRTGHHPLLMSPGLLSFLGHEFDPKPENGVFNRITTFEGQRVVDTHRGFDTLFIYCDALTPRIVGDSNSSLLITLPNGGKRVMFGDIVNNRITKIRYYPVSKRRFHSIRIDIRTDIGAQARFEGGKVFVELHFRKVKSE